MNILKRILNWFRGVRADYNLRTYSPDRSYLRGNNESVRFDLSPWDRMEAMRRARFFEKCNPLVQGMLRVHETYVVGCGLKVSPNTSSPEFNIAAQAAFESWAEDCEVSCEQSLYVSQGVWARRRFIEIGGGTVSANVVVNGGYITACDAVFHGNNATAGGVVTARFNNTIINGSYTTFTAGPMTLNQVVKTTLPWRLEIEMVCRAQGSGTSANTAVANVAASLVLMACAISV